VSDTPLAYQYVAQLLTPSDTKRSVLAAAVRATVPGTKGAAAAAATTVAGAAVVALTLTEPANTTVTPVPAVMASTGEAGKTKMLYAYGYIRRTKGLDGDHVDVFVGPNEKAESVYVIMTNKAPDFVMADEEKCMLGFDTQDDAKAAFLKHYDKPGFFRSIAKMSFAKFEKRVFETYDGTRKKVAEDADFTPPTFFDEKDRGLPPVGDTRLILGEPRSRQDRISAQFGYHDLPPDTTAVGP